MVMFQELNDILASYTDDLAIEEETTVEEVEQRATMEIAAWRLSRSLLSGFFEAGRQTEDASAEVLKERTANLIHTVNNFQEAFVGENYPSFYMKIYSADADPNERKRAQETISDDIGRFNHYIKAMKAVNVNAFSEEDRKFNFQCCLLRLGVLFRESVNDAGVGDFSQLNQDFLTKLTTAYLNVYHSDIMANLSKDSRVTEEYQGSLVMGLCIFVWTGTLPVLGCAD